jgi:hypothetical protein
MTAQNMTPAPVTTREAWLGQAIDALRPLFAEAGMEIPAKVRVSVGFGFNGARENAAILAQTWARSQSEDQVPSIFLSPVIETRVDALSALCHELVHVVDDCEHGHGYEFKAMGARLGLEGKPTRMLPGVMLSATIITLVETLGEYPHRALIVEPVRAPIPAGGVPSTLPPVRRVRTGPATQTNRAMLRRCITAGCVVEGYAIRTTRKWLALAEPICPVCYRQMG